MAHIASSIVVLAAVVAVVASIVLLAAAVVAAPAAVRAFRARSSLRFFVSFDLASMLLLICGIAETSPIQQKRCQSPAPMERN